MCSLFAMFLAMLFLVWSQIIKSLLRHSLTFTKIPVKILYLAYIQYHLNIHQIMCLELLKENKNFNIKFNLWWISKSCIIFLAIINSMIKILSLVKYFFLFRGNKAEQLLKYHLYFMLFTFIYFTFLQFF